MNTRNTSYRFSDIASMVVRMETKDRINYTYRSDGVKMREQSTHQYTKLVMKISASGDTTYVQRNASDTHFRAHYGNYVKETGMPDKIYNEEGYIALHGDSVSYHFFERDYLGSVRAVFDLYGNLEQTNDYNVTGIPSSRHLGNSDVHKHTGKEFQGFNGLAWYDNNARYYDPILGRFTSQDPLAEKYPELSPYVHCFNNPIGYFDPNGKDGIASVYQNKVTIGVTIYIYGSGATKETASIMQNNINNYWCKNPKTNKSWIYLDSSTKKTYTIEFNVNVNLFNPDNPNDTPELSPNRYNNSNLANFIEVNLNSDRSSVLGSNKGVWRGAGRQGRTLEEDDPSVHEFGHLLNLEDHYTDEGGAEKGWEGNVMAEPVMNGTVDQRNINSIVEPIIKSFNNSNGNPNKEFKYEIK